MARLKPSIPLDYFEGRETFSPAEFEPELVCFARAVSFARPSSSLGGSQPNFSNSRLSKAGFERLGGGGGGTGSTDHHRSPPYREEKRNRKRKRVLLSILRILARQGKKGEEEVRRRGGGGGGGSSSKHFRSSNHSAKLLFCSRQPITITTAWFASRYRTTVTLLHPHRSGMTISTPICKLHRFVNWKAKKKIGRRGKRKKERIIVQKILFSKDSRVVWLVEYIFKLSFEVIFLTRFVIV